MYYSKKNDMNLSLESKNDPDTTRMKITFALIHINMKEI